VANVVHPRITRTRLSLAELGLLSYCIPSTRGDRPTDAASLAERYPGITAGRVRELAGRHVLLPAAEAACAYDQTRLWSAYNWYPSLLAHLETRSAVRAAEPIESEPGIAVIDGMAPDQVAGSLGRRQTCRSFADTAISAEDLAAIVCAAGDDRFRSITTTAVLHNVAGQAPGSVGRFDAGTFWDGGRRLTRAQVREAAIGQYPASQGALVLWLTTDVDLTSPRDYEATIVALGAVAQRLILAATQRGLAVFCTPAINDDMAFARLGLPGAGPQTITYVLTIGKAAS
jgi:Nitroreductase family